MEEILEFSARDLFYLSSSGAGSAFQKRGEKGFPFHKGFPFFVDSSKKLLHNTNVAIICF